MTSPSRWFRGLALTGTLGFVACTCGGTTKIAPDRATGAAAHPPLTLSELPVTPAVQIPPPQPNDQSTALTVVVARPNGPVFGEVRPTITFSKPVMALG